MSENALDSKWKTIFMIGGIASAAMIGLAFLDIALSTVSSGEDIVAGSLPAVEWFDMFQNDAFAAFRNLGIINIVSQILIIPIALSFYELHRRTDGPFGLLSLIVILFGGILYISDNTVFPMWALSRSYASATTEVQKAAFIAAGEAMLARGADFTPGSLISFVLPSLGSLMMQFVLLRGDVFKKAAVYTGLIAYALLMVFAVWVTFSPSSFDVAMMVVIPAGLLVMVWEVLVARKLILLSRSGS